MKFFNPDGSKKFCFRAASLTHEGLREYFAEINTLKTQGITPKRAEYFPVPPPVSAVTSKVHTPRMRKGKVKVVKASSFRDSLNRDPEADFVLYYLRFPYKNRRFYKIGVTTRSVESRYGDDFKKIGKVLLEERVVGALKVEKQILEQFHDHLFPLAILRDGNGYTEFFDADVLELDEKPIAVHIPDHCMG